jgi:hypothetical protein
VCRIVWAVYVHVHIKHTLLRGAVCCRCSELSMSQQEAQHSIELLLDAFLFVTRTKDMLSDGRALLHAAPEAASQLQLALQCEHDSLGAGACRLLPFYLRSTPLIAKSTLKNCK